MKVKIILKYTLPIILASVLFYYAFREVSLSAFLSKISEVNYWWVLLSAALAMWSHWLRAYRWNLILSPLGYKNLSDKRTFLAIMTGYLANLAFPRLGEVTRCGVMKRNEGIPVSISFGTVITERLIDFFILLSLIILDFIIEFDRVYYFFLESVGWDLERDHIWTFVGIGFALVVGGIVGVLMLKKILEQEFENPLLQKAHRMMTDLVNGLLSVRKVENSVGFVFSTVGIWVLYYLMSFVIFYTIPETSGLGIGAGLTILATAGVAMAMPVQGGIGAYHTLVSGVLIVYGIEATTGLFFATLLHTSQLVLMLLAGGICVMITALFVPKHDKTEITKNT